MKYEITEDHASRFNDIYNSSGVDRFDSFKKALEDFVSSIPDPLPSLRPIAEMPEEVPEGCVRTYYRAKQGELDLASFASAEYFADAQLPPELMPPSPEDKWRAEFEEKMKAKYPAASVSRETNGDYFSDATSYSWDGFKLAKATPETK